LPLKGYDAEHAEQKESKQLGDPQEFQNLLGRGLLDSAYRFGKQRREQLGHSMHTQRRMLGAIAILAAEGNVGTARTPVPNGASALSFALGSEQGREMQFLRLATRHPDVARIVEKLIPSAGIR
jgi:hypothetical protein